GVIALDGDVVAVSEHAVRVKAAAAPKASVLRRSPIEVLDIYHSPAKVVAHSRYGLAKSWAPRQRGVLSDSLTNRSLEAPRH
ncbi:MAG TPA: hypothetical protein VKP00_13380, partial [Gemmatimonadaceae bacterium]|nr:hypothetical protein [Gemmatimonadaceae bacterium]